MNGDGQAFLALIALICVLLIVVWLLTVIPSLGEWMRELRYLNREIGRTTGSEQKRWKKKRRKLFLALLPFIKY